MKLRIRDNSLRLRLTRSEVSLLGSGKPIQKSISFSPSSSLQYVAETDSQISTIVATFEAGKIIRVRIPLSIARDWGNTETVELRSEQSVGTGSPLLILIEKDFECLHSRNEADSDAFPNPRNS
jgi:hypothetical protein